MYIFPNDHGQHLLASLILGYMRHVLSRTEYSQLRMFVALGNLDLPHWNGLRASRLRIRKLLKMDIDFKESVLHNPCYVINLKHIIAQVSWDFFGWDIQAPELIQWTFLSGAGQSICQSTPGLLSRIYTREEYIQDVSMLQMARRSESRPTSSNGRGE